MDAIASCVKPICEVVFPSLLEHARALVQLEKSAATLFEEMKDLRDLEGDIENDVLVQERDPEMKRRNQVNSWLENVDALGREVDALEQTFVGRATACLDGCCWSSYQLSRGVVRLLVRVRELKEKGGTFTALAAQSAPEALEAVPSSSGGAGGLTGAGRTLSSIRALVRGGEARVIGIYGMGGIGKTTLLKEISNEFLVTGTGDYDKVLWATVSKELDLLKIQEQIAGRLGLSLPSAEQAESRARALFKALSKKRFLLLLDDLWQKVDLVDLGVPYPDGRNKCRVAFTTRSEKVCSDMDAQAKVQVSLLDKVESWELFCKKMGRSEGDEVLDDPSIRSIAEKIVARCGGLPLALITVGRAMASKKTLREWRHACNVLLEKKAAAGSRAAPGTPAGKDVFALVQEDVLSLLKFSYDELENDTLRSCLLYCALFPEDHEIDREQLVEYWIGEDFLDDEVPAGEEDEDVDDVEGDDIDAVRCKGDDLIGNLLAACLLESGTFDEEKKVKMHDEVREMALWITATADPSSPNHKFLVHAGRGTAVPPPKAERWRGAKRISLMQNSNLTLPEKIPDCPDATTLLMNGNPYHGGVSDGHLRSLQALRVLDVSSARIYSLPASIGLLIQLRYLNISTTRMVSLPEELGNLHNLRQLDMRSTSYLMTIPLEAFANLRGLQTLNMFRSNYSWAWAQTEDAGAGGDQGESRQQEKAACLKHLQGLTRLNELGLDIRTLDCLEALVRSEVLRPIIKLLSLTVVPGLTADKVSIALGSMKNLRVLHLSTLRELEELQFRDYELCNLEAMVMQYLDLTRVACPDAGELALRCLRRLEISGCHFLREVTWAGGLRCLELLDVHFCDNIEEILVVGDDGGSAADGEEVDGRVFRLLKGMDLQSLPRLRSVAGGRRVLLLPCLEKLNVYGCPELKSLSLGRSSGKKMKLIRGQQAWWDALEWEDDELKSAFLRHFTDPY